MLTDIRQAVRQLLNNPRFSLVACLTLALGIGANTAIFSVVDAALFRPLPYKSADRLVDVLVEAKMRAGGTALVQASGRHAERLRAIPQVFDRVEAFSDPGQKALATGWGPSPWVGALSPGLPAFFGIAPQLGRVLTREDALAGTAVLISDAYWTRMYNRDRAAIGKTIAFADRTCVVVGVMPPTFRYFVGAYTDAWLPLADESVGDRLLARLRPGITLAQAQREANAALARAARPMRIELLAAGWDRGTSAFGAVATRTMLLTLLGAVGFVMAIACANVANLLLSRALTRQREIAIREALGASRLRLARQFLVEGLALAALGGAAATAIAWAAIRAIPALVPANQLRALFGVSLPALDLRVLLFAVAVAIVTGVVCGAAPALRASSAVAARDGLLAAGRHIAGGSPTQRHVRSTFQAIQVALTLVLLAGAGLLVVSFVRMIAVPSGFNDTNLAYASLDVPRGWKTAQFVRFFDDACARIGSLPGVRGVTVAMPPVAGYSDQFVLEERDGPSSIAVPMEEFFVQPNYFQVAGIALKEGRLFGPEDQKDTLRVAIVNERTARRFWPGRSAVGERFKVKRSDALVTIVGVVSDVRTLDVSRDKVQAYLPGTQAGGPNYLLFRTAGAPAPVVAAIRGEIRALDPGVTIRTIGMVSGLVAEADPLGMPRFYASILGLLAGIALLTAAVGLYGLLSYSVGRRIQEIGVRMALGADAARVQWLVVRDALGPVVAGVACGLLASWWLTRFLASQLFRMQPHDPLTLASIVILLVAVSAAAAFGPARRASRVDPVEALRAD